ncbi:MAG: phage integrase family protein [Acidobacteriota bacterium]
MDLPEDTLLSAVPPRRRGRPPGARTRLMLEDRVLGIHHFAFLRAWLQGLDLRWAWDRYLAFSEVNADLRHIEHRRKELLASALQQGHQLNRTLPKERQITDWLNILSREPVIAPSLVRPSLDAFIAQQGWDRDLYSEAEWLDLYAEHHGETAEPDDAPSRSEHVKAINQLAMLIALPPYPTDLLGRWLVPSLVERLRRAGIGDLASLVEFINVFGYRWYRKIDRLGETRARQIVQWLQSIEDTTGLVLRESALSPPQAQFQAQAAVLQTIEPQTSFAIVPLTQLAVPPALSGAKGAFRTHMPNTLGARDDLEAIRHWLRKYEERKNTHTAYQREVERFYLWCLHVCGKPLSSIDAMDCQAFRKFLQNIPPDWQNPKTGPCAPQDWRPFRGPLKPITQKRALVAVQVMFEALRKAGYLVANPMADVFTHFNLPESHIDVDRSFTDREWALVMQQAHALPDTPRRTRLILLLELLVSMGLRLDELSTATTARLKQVQVDGDPLPAWVLSVIGKRRKVREVLMPDHVVTWLRQHHREMGVAPDASVPTEGLPLMLASDKRLPTAPQPAPGNRLSSAGIYATLKRFFKRVAQEASAQGLDAKRFERASTHWMRHTFGRQAASDEVPIEIIQQALGHTSITTTTIYTTTERSRMIKQLRKMRTPA